MPQDFTARESILEPGTLWEKLLQASAHGLRCGALQPIATHYEFVEQQGLRFLVRTLPHLVQKDQGQPPKSSSPNFNPFLPYDPDLWVANLSDTHVCLLNKFNVTPHHLLIVTRTFEDQETLLTLGDFEALWTYLAEIDGLAFYNSGPQAGASQRHKHLQLVPLPLAPQGPTLPLQPALEVVQFQEGLGISPALPFVHAMVNLNLLPGTTPIAAAEVMLAGYQRLLSGVGLRTGGAYNLLATRQWMMLVPRTQDSFQAIPVNALGFAGTLLTRNEEQRAHLKALGPLTLLQKVAVSQEPA